MENQNAKNLNLEDNPIRTSRPRKKNSPFKKHDSHIPNPDDSDVRMTTWTTPDAREEDQPMLLNGSDGSNETVQ